MWLSIKKNVPPPVKWILVSKEASAVFMRTISGFTLVFNLENWRFYCHKETIKFNTKNY